MPYLTFGLVENSARKLECGAPDAGWSSQVAREAHNLEVVGSNPAPATLMSGYSYPGKKFKSRRRSQ